MKDIQVLIVGAGLGGLACAIGCRRQGLTVTVLERDHELTEYGAGIQLPPNAARVMHNYDLLDTLIEHGQAASPEYIEMRRYDGELLTKRPLRMKHWLGFHHSIHRVDYQRILADEAQRLGAVLKFDCKVNEIACKDARPSVTLDDGGVVEADVIIGADGMFSAARKAVLQEDVQPMETGDLAWRAAVTRANIAASGNAELIQATSEGRPLGWLGPSSHVAFYPLRNATQYNLVLAYDNLALWPRSDTADLRAFFADWDPLLNVVLSQVDEVQKWKLMHLPPLERWTRGAVALMGDACHPTLPYQAQGAAMAVEDGATIAEMLGLLSQSPQWADDTADQAVIAQTLQLYEQVRKQRTELNVRGADANRIFLHLPRGLELEKRDQMLREWDWNDSTASSKWPFLDPTYARELMGFDAEAEARAAFERKFGPGGVDSSSPRHSRDNVP